MKLVLIAIVVGSMACVPGTMTGSSGEQGVPSDVASEEVLDAGAVDGSRRDVSGADDVEPDSAPDVLVGVEDSGAMEDVGGSEEDGPDAEPQDDRIYTVAVIADMNESYGSTHHRQTVHDAMAWIVDQIAPDVVLSTGDMVAGQQAGHDYRAMWQAFHAAVTTPITTAGIPLAVSPGNHDASGYASFAAEREIFVDEWKQQRPAVNFLDETNYPLHYAFEIGPALFISLDATRVGPLNGDQRQWVANILETYQDYPIKFIYGHIPLFPVAQGRETEILQDFELERILNDYGVQMMISGHHHAYYPGRRGSLQLMHTACLGAGPRRLITQSEVSERSVIVIHYDASGILSSEAYGGADFQRVIERSSLPESLNTGDLLIYRDDL
ncbi:MAG: metallophosphoesterase family protein [Bradymonadaceae bacterium]